MKKILIILTFGFIAAVSVNAQDQTKNGWNFKVEPYLMAPYMVGSVGIANLPNVELDATAGDIFSNLKGAFMLYTEANNGQWAITADFVYMKLQQDVKPGNLITGGDVTFTESIFAMEGFYRLLPWLEAGLAGRVVTLGGDMTVTRNEVGQNGGTITSQADVTKTWFDPVIAIRAQVPNSDIWIGEFKADYGGFGVGSQSTYQLQLYGGYRFSKLFQATVGYRFLAIDYESGSASDRFLFNVNTSGAVLRLGFNF
jgi:hypothetical protein